MNTIDLISHNEILNLTPIQLKILCYIRSVANENMYWISYSSLSTVLQIEQEQLIKTLNELTGKGAIITHSIVANNVQLNQQAFYITDYEPSNNKYYITITLDEVKTNLKKMIQLKEVEFSVKNNKNPRDITIRQHQVSNLKLIKDEKNENINKIIDYIHQVYDITIKKTEAKLIYDDIIFINFGKYNQNLLEQKANIVHDYTLHNEVDNIVGCIRTAINQDWHSYKCNIKIKTKDEQYTASELEKNLLQDWQTGC